MKMQFKNYCEEIRFIYDKEKANLRAKINELTSSLSVLERDKEQNNEVIQSSIREVNMLYNQKIDYLQKELLDTRTEANTRLISLSRELEQAQVEIKSHEETIASLRNKLKDVKYQFEISQKAASYRLEKSE